MVVYLPNLKQICQGIKAKCAVLFSRGMATFGLLIFHFISILVMALRTKRDNSQSWAYIYFFNSCTYFSSFPPPASSDFYVIFHRISLKLWWLIDSNMFIRWLHFQKRNRKSCVLQFLCHFWLNVSQSWLVLTHWVVDYYYNTRSGPYVNVTKRCSDCKILLSVRTSYHLSFIFSTDLFEISNGNLILKLLYTCQIWNISVKE